MRSGCRPSPAPQDYNLDSSSANALDERFAANVSYARALTGQHVVLREAHDAVEEYTLRAASYVPARGAAKASPAESNESAGPPLVGAGRTPLIVLGSEGGGKSATLAYWLLTHKRCSKQRCVRACGRFCS